jgi:aldehyde:ferredoxin oxidoreductase
LRYIPEHGPNRGPLTFEQARAVCAQVYGEPDACNPNVSYEAPNAWVSPAIFHHNRGMTVESLVLCDREHTRVFSMQTADHKADTALMSKLFSAVTGYETSEQELDQSGERVFNLLRAIDIRNSDRSRQTDDAVARSLAFPAFTDGVVLDVDKFARVLDHYYKARGWNPANGYPTRARLEALGLQDIADGLQAANKIG